MNSFCLKILQFLQKNKVLTALALLLTVIAELAYLNSYVKVDQDLKSLFDRENITITDLSELDRQMGSFSQILITASSPDRNKNIETLKLIKKEIENDPLIRYVDLERKTTYLKDHALLYVPLDDLKEAEKRIKNNIANYTVKSFALGEDNSDEQIQINFLLSEILNSSRKYRNDHKFARYMEAYDGRLVSMYVRPDVNDTDLKEIKKIFSVIDDAIEKIQSKQSSVKVEASGPFREKLTEAESIFYTSFVAGVIALLVLMILLTIHFRSTLITTFIFISLFMGFVSAISGISLLTRFNIASLLSLPLIIGIGVNMLVSYTGRFIKQQGFIFNNRKAVYDTLFTILFSVMIMFPFIFNDIKGFSDFIIGTLVGLSLFAPVALLSLTVLFNFFSKDRISNLKISSYFKKSSMNITITMIMVLCLLTAVSIHEYRVHTDIEKKASICMEYLKFAGKDRYSFLAAGLPSFIITDSYQETLDASQTLEKLKNSSENKVPLIDYISIEQFIPQHQKKKLEHLSYIHSYIEQKKNLLDEDTLKKYRQDIEPYLKIRTVITKKTIPSWIKDKLRLKNGDIDRLLILGIGGNKSNTETVAKIKKEYGTIKGTKNYYTLKGSYLLLTEIENALNTNWGLRFFISLLIAAVILFLRFRTVPEINYHILSFLSGALFAAIPFLPGVELNIYNITVFPVAIGLGYHSASVDLKYKETSGSESFHPSFISSMTLFSFFILLALSENRMNSAGIIASGGIFLFSASGIYLPENIKKASSSMRSQIIRWSKKCME